jgi:hypothetical protein
MYVVGKLRGRAAVAATAQPGRPGRLAVLADESSKVLYLVDTGAVYSVIPFTSTAPPSGPAITAADGTAIPCWGWRAVTVTAGGQTFKWNFLLAAAGAAAAWRVRPVWRPPSAGGGGDTILFTFILFSIILSTFSLSFIILFTFNLYTITWRCCRFAAGGSRGDKS